MGYIRNGLIEIAGIRIIIELFDAKFKHAGQHALRT